MSLALSLVNHSLSAVWYLQFLEDLCLKRKKVRRKNSISGQVVGFGGGGGGGGGFYSSAATTSCIISLGIV